MDNNDKNYLSDDDIIGELRKEILSKQTNKENKTYHYFSSCENKTLVYEDAEESIPPIVKPVVEKYTIIVEKKKPCRWKTGVPKWWAWPVVLIVRQVLKAKEKYNEIQTNHI